MRCNLAGRLYKGGKGFNKRARKIKVPLVGYIIPQDAFREAARALSKAVREPTTTRKESAKQFDFIFL